jgi:hypothetical protein
MNEKWESVISHGVSRGTLPSTVLVHLSPLSSFDHPAILSSFEVNVQHGTQRHDNTKCM